MMRHGRATRFRRTVVDCGAPAAAATTTSEGWAPADREPCRTHGHSLRAQVWYSLGDAASGDGLWIGHDLLAQAARLAGGGRVAASAPGPAGPLAPSGPDRLEPRRAGQCVRAGEKGGEGTGANPTDRGKAGCKRHVLVDRNGTPLSLVLSPANRHDSQMLVPALDAVPPVRGKPGRPRRRPDKLHADKAGACPRAGGGSSGLPTRLPGAGHCASDRPAWDRGQPPPGPPPLGRGAYAGLVLPLSPADDPRSLSSGSDPRERRLDIWTAFNALAADLITLQQVHRFC